MALFLTRAEEVLHLDLLLDLRIFEDVGVVLVAISLIVLLRRLHRFGYHGQVEGVVESLGGPPPLHPPPSPGSLPGRWPGFLVAWLGGILEGPIEKS